MQTPIKARAGATPQWKETSKLRRMKATTYESKTPTPLSLYVANFSPTEFKSADPNCIFQCSYLSKTFAAPDLQRLVQRMQALSFLKIFPETNSNRPNQIYSDAVQLLSITHGVTLLQYVRTAASERGAWLNRPRVR